MPTSLEAASAVEGFVNSAAEAGLVVAVESVEVDLEMLSAGSLAVASPLLPSAEFGTSSPSAAKIG